MVDVGQFGDVVLVDALVEYVALSLEVVGALVENVALSLGMTSVVTLHHTLVVGRLVVVTHLSLECREGLGVHLELLNLVLLQGLFLFLLVQQLVGHGGQGGRHCLGGHFYEAGGGEGHGQWFVAGHDLAVRVLYVGVIGDVDLGTLVGYHLNIYKLVHIRKVCNVVGEIYYRL